MFDQLDLTNTEEISWSPPKTDSLYRYNRACSILEEYIHRNFYRFTETELVYKWAKGLCEIRIAFDNWYRSFGWMYGERYKAVEHYDHRRYFMDAMFYKEMHRNL
jgi:hypothetical protein